MAKACKTCGQSMPASKPDKPKGSGFIEEAEHMAGRVKDAYGVLTGKTQVGKIGKMLGGK